MPRPTLYGIAYSPWTYKARWALERKRIDYAYREYLPMVGQAPMRMRLNRWSTPVTVPLMRWDNDVLDNSLAIAARADVAETEPKLHVENPSVQYWNDISDRILELGRIRISLAIQGDKRALQAALPKFLKRIPGRIAIAKLGAKYMLKTYPVATHPDDLLASTMTYLEDVRKALTEGPWLIGQPSYADMAIASSLQMISPTNTHLIPLDPDLHEVWGHMELKHAFADLCHWRDRVMAALDAPRFGDA